MYSAFLVFARLYFGEGQRVTRLKFVFSLYGDRENQHNNKHGSSKNDQKSFTEQTLLI